MPKTLKDLEIKELSLIFSEHKGERWKQRNPDAVVLATKGAPEKAPSASVFDRFAQTLKGWLIPDDVEVEDKIDNDGDGAEDYEQIAWLIIGAANDLQQGFSISGDTARAALVVATVDTFLANLDDVRGGGKGDVAKAGKRHSAADQERIDKIGEHLEAASKLHSELAGKEASQEKTDGETTTGGSGAGEDDETKGAIAALDAWKAGPVGDDGLPENADELVALEQKAKKDGVKSKDPYGDVEYADPGYQDDKKKRYPLDSEEHVRSAASYFGMEKNRSKYTDEQQKKIDAKIAAAKKKFGIGDDDKSDKGAPEPIDADAIVAKAAEKLLDAMRPMIDSVKAHVDTKLQEHAAEVDAKLADHTEKTKAAGESVTRLKASVDAIVGAARQPSAPVGQPTFDGEGFKAAPINDDRVTKVEIPDGAGAQEAVQAILAAQRLSTGATA